MSDIILRTDRLVLDPYFSAAKMAWIRASRATGVATTTDTWLVHRFVTDVSK
jgi:glycerol kinase